MKNNNVNFFKIIFLILFLIFSFNLYTHYKEIKQEKFAYDNLHNYFKDIDKLHQTYITFDYWGKILFLDKNLTKINSFNLGMDTPMYKLWGVNKINDELWFGFSSIVYTCNIVYCDNVKTNKIFIINTKNSSTYKLIELPNLYGPYKFCNDNNFVYMTSYQSGGEFGYAKINLNNYLVIFNELIGDYNMDPSPEIFCNINNSNYVLTSGSLVKFNKNSSNFDLIYRSNDDNIQYNYFNNSLSTDNEYIHIRDLFLKEQKYIQNISKNKDNSHTVQSVIYLE